MKPASPQKNTEAPLILCIETATKACSVAIGQTGKILALKESVDEQFSHAEKLTVFIEEACKEAGLTLHQVDAIAVSKGPGSYTGLRIGVSAAKGLCYALDKPLIAVNTLHAMASGCSHQFQHLLSLTPSPSPRGEGNNSPEYHTANGKLWEGLKQLGKKMRKDPTKAEALLWERLRNNKIGYKIRRQHSIEQFVCDFVCLEKLLVIEVDGKIHDFQRGEDLLRECIIGERHFGFLRFSNDEVYDDINGVVAKIKNTLDNIAPPLRGGVGGGAKNQNLLFCPMIDARRMEVYCAVYDTTLKEIHPTSALVIDENSFAEYLAEGLVLFFGDGAEKCKALIRHTNARFLDGYFPSAQYLLPLAEKVFAQKQFEDLAYFEPYYLKDFVSGSVQKK